MKPLNYIIGLAFFLCFSSFAEAQNKIQKTLKKTFYYSFENVNAEEQVEKLKTKVSLLKGVTEVKSEYDQESGKGQIIVVVIEKEINNEGDPQFDILLLKKSIIDTQLLPSELTQEESPIAN
jgi:copper chaperone CopZ